MSEFSELINHLRRGALAGGKNTLFVCSVAMRDPGDISCEKNVWTNNHDILASDAKLALGYSL